MKNIFALEDQATQYQGQLNNVIDEVSILQFQLYNKLISCDQFKVALNDLKSGQPISDKKIRKSVRSIWIKYAESAEYGSGESVEVFMNNHYTSLPSL